MKRILFILIATLGVVSTGCQNQILCTLDHNYTRSVQVVLHWDDDELATKPMGTMRGNFFSLANSRGQLFWDLEYDTTDVNLIMDTEYAVLSYDYDRDISIYFRGENDPNLIEAICVPKVRKSFTKDNPSQVGKTFGEAPYPFYVATQKTDQEGNYPLGSFTLSEDSEHGEHTIHLYPRNITKMYTFRIMGDNETGKIGGIEHVQKSWGGISGMSASYFMGTGLLSSDPSTIFFQAEEDVENGWIEGKFATFGSLADNDFSIEIFYPTGQAASMAWDVTEQVVDAACLNDENNPDIIVRWDIEIIPVVKEPNGGVDVTVVDWEEIVVPLGAPARFESRHEMVYCPTCGISFMQEYHVPYKSTLEESARHSRSHNHSEHEHVH